MEEQPKKEQETTKRIKGRERKTAAKGQRQKGRDCDNLPCYQEP